jgi:hypothetical protein
MSAAALLWRGILQHMQHMGHAAHEQGTLTRHLLWRGMLWHMAINRSPSKRGTYSHVLVMLQHTGHAALQAAAGCVDMHDTQDMKSPAALPRHMPCVCSGTAEPHSAFNIARSNTALTSTSSSPRRVPHPQALARPPAAVHQSLLPSAAAAGPGGTSQQQQTHWWRQHGSTLQNQRGGGGKGGG